MAPGKPSTTSNVKKLTGAKGRSGKLLTRKKKVEAISKPNGEQRDQKLKVMQPVGKRASRGDPF